jgi:sirohydrochlorin ferrochelatase
LADGFDDICNAIASAASDQEAVDALADAMLGDPDLMPYVLERALEARGMDIGRLDDLWDEAERIVAEQAGWGDGFSEG